MKRITLMSLLYLLLFSSCLKEDKESDIDLEAPSILPYAGNISVQPQYFLKTDTDVNEIPLAFSITDATGIQQIKIESHSGFDGHTHGKSASSINKKFKLFSHSEVIETEQITDPNLFNYTSSIFLDDRNPDIDEDELILGGPYHFSIQATDVEGNETSYLDNSTYHTTLYLNTTYAPQLELTDLNIPNEIIAGRVYRNTDHNASSDISFLWIYIEEPNTENPGQEGTILEEWVWGKSNWPHQYRANEGNTLPDTQEIDLQNLFTNNSDFFTTLQGNTLVVWAEDSNGNISVNQFNN